MSLLLLGGLAKAATGVKKKAQDALLSIAFELQGNVQESMRTTPRGGGGGGGGGEQTNAQRKAMFAALRKRQGEPSKPGNAPAIQTGNLVRNVIVDDSALESMRVRVGVFDNAPYAVFLEFGTQSMAARPYLKPALEEVKEFAKSLLKGVQLEESGPVPRADV